MDKNIASLLYRHSGEPVRRDGAIVGGIDARGYCGLAGGRRMVTEYPSSG